jgi:lantibiotic modifying enzyme
LGDAADREQILDVLWTEAVGHPLRWQLSRHELADLWAGDVPMFTTRPGSHDVWTADGNRLTGLLNRTGLAHALAKLEAMNEVDRRHQEWIISATMATRRPAGGHRSSLPASGPVTGTAADPERLLAASCAIADQIVARGMATDGRVNWLGLEFVDDRQWLVLPMGAGLASGYPGVAVFLAQLAELSGIHRYAEVARRAIGAVPQLLDMVAGRPDLVPVIGSGALQGFGGIAYALARLGTLLGDSEAHQWARACAEHAAHADLAGGPVDWATGSAGCLAALSAVQRELGESADGAIGLLARECAERLVEQDDVADGRGFAFGAAGTAWALAQVADLGFAGAAQAALARATTDDAHGWCSGLAGTAIAQAAVEPGQLDSTTLWALAERPVLRDLSLCHGELGITEALTVLAAQMPAAAALRRRRAGLALDAIERYGRGCATPGEVSTPGLLHGLAGIGYGLLRLGFADRVPSVLLLEPKPS